MTTVLTTDQLMDLEALVRPLAVRPKDRYWVPLGLYTVLNEPVHICLKPWTGRSVAITDEGELLANFRDSGLTVKPDSKLLGDISAIARQYGFKIDEGALFRAVSSDEVPAGVLNMAECQIAIAGRLFAYMREQHEVQFRVIARNELDNRLSTKARKLTYFEPDYAERYQEGDFFCFVDLAKPVGVKLVTNRQNMLDAIVVNHMYSGNGIDLAALKKPDARLGGRRVVNFQSAYHGRIFEDPQRLAQFINKLAG